MIPLSNIQILLGVALLGLTSPLAAQPANLPPSRDADSVSEELGVGDWIWTTNTTDNQTCNLWRSFTVPKDIAVDRATLRITADNSYRVYLDGFEIGSGTDWRHLREYDLTARISSGRHVLAVGAFNDFLQAGVLLGLKVQFGNGDVLKVVSDASWLVVSSDSWGWRTRKEPESGWFPARIVGVPGKPPWWARPYRIIDVPPVLPQPLHFWQRTWFLALLLAICAAVAIVCARQATQLTVQRRAQRMLEAERIRIARDIHDELGAGLTQLTLLGELVLREIPREVQTRNHLDALCRKARALLGSMDEIVWTVNSSRDTVSDFAGFACEQTQELLGPASIRCRFDVPEALPRIPLNLPARRNLLLAVKEAVRNAARHSGATELSLAIRLNQQHLEVTVQDNGKGFAFAHAPGNRNGLINMKHRLSDIGGTCEITTREGAGCRVVLTFPLTSPRIAKDWLALFPSKRAQGANGSG
jgi:signal transduction histidine kinase